EATERVRERRPGRSLPQRPLTLRALLERPANEGAVAARDALERAGHALAGRDELDELLVVRLRLPDSSGLQLLHVSPYPMEHWGRSPPSRCTPILGFVSTLEIGDFADEHLDAAAALLAERHRRHRVAEPLLPARFEDPDAARD